MRPTSKTLILVSVLLLLIFFLGTIVAVLMGWPAQFGGQGDPSNVAGEFLTRGTALSPPLLPVLVMIAFTLTAPRQDLWGRIAVIGLCILAVLFIVGSLGEAFAPPTPDVPRAALVTSGIMGVVASLALLALGIKDLRERRQTSRRAITRS